MADIADCSILHGDILIYIFRCIAEFSKAEPLGYQNIINMSYVCKSWNVAAHSPVVWEPVTLLIPANLEHTDSSGTCPK